jgi:DNA-binding LacI/PurR family transcriptional regulator
MIRRDALVSALAERGRAAPVIHEADGVDPGDLQAVAAKIGRSRPDAVVCYDDKTALLLMDELRTAGVRIPDDIGIVGFDDIPFARISNPRLTSVSQRSDELGRISVDFLLSTVETGKLPGSQLMPVALVVRETTPGPAPRAQRNDK